LALPQDTVGGQAPVKPDFFIAEQQPFLQGGKIQKPKFTGFLIL